MFSFLTKDKTPSIGKRTLQSINEAVYQFLHVREVQHFKCYTIDYENNPVVLIQAVPQKKLRFSNILEIQIKRHLREKLGFQVSAIFWRFKTDASEEPGPEQADYEFEEKPEYPQDQARGPEALAALKSAIDAEANANPQTISKNNEHYDVRHLARKGMEVEEISMGEFDEFLKGAGNTISPQD